MRVNSRGLKIEPPLVSVIVTTYNYERFICECLGSIAAQGYRKFECIVIDDCSTDNTPAVVMDYLDTLADERFRYIRLPKNLGQLGAQRAGFEQSHGQFVVFADADDILFPEFVSRHLFVHHNIETAVGFTSSDQWTITEDGQLLAKYHTDMVSRLYSSQGIDVEVRLPQFEEDAGMPPVQGILFPFWRGKDEPKDWVWGTQSTMMFRRALLSLILPGESEDVDGFRICSDFYMARLGQLIGGSFVFREALGCYRRHGRNNFSTNGLIAARMQSGNMRRHPSGDAFRRLTLQVLAKREHDVLSVLGTKRLSDLIDFIRSLPPDSYDPGDDAADRRRRWNRIRRPRRVFSRR